LKSALIASLLALLLSAGAIWVWLHQPLPTSVQTVELSIESGTTPRRIAEDWVSAGIQTPPWLLYQWFRWSGDAKRIRAGSYQIDRPTTPIELLEMMVSGNETMAFVRLTEGWTLSQVRAELARADALKPLTAAMSHAEVMAAMGDGDTPAGGRLGRALAGHAAAQRRRAAHPGFDRREGNGQPH
jgi:UPF0755 protein